MRSIPWSEMLATETKKQKSTKERRRAPRAKVSQNVWVRPRNADLAVESCLTLNVSRNGVCFETGSDRYFAGMAVFVTRNFLPNDPANREETGTVVRVNKLKDGRWGVAIKIL